MSVLNMTPSFSFTSSQKKLALYTLFCALTAMILFMPQVVWAADLFTAAKTEITESTGKSSTLWFAVTLAGFAVAALTGFITKNWIAAIGGFFAGMIFMNAGAAVIGLA